MSALAVAITYAVLGILKGNNLQKFCNTGLKQNIFLIYLCVLMVAHLGRLKFQRLRIQLLQVPFCNLVRNIISDRDQRFMICQKL